MEINIAAPKNFSFKRTARSHGWSGLAPFALDESRWSLSRVLSLGGGTAVTIKVSEGPGCLLVKVPGSPSVRALRQVERDVRHMFRLDDEMEEFYLACNLHPDFQWIGRAGAGRLLRSPTVYEDLVKSICTTNCSWALTERMVNGLVDSLGVLSNDGRRAFPTAEAMARQPESFYRDTVRAGYRSSYIKELANRVASGEIDVESWLTTDKPTVELKREMKRVKGVGDYAAENLLKLVGRYEGLALDSWLRGRFALTRNNRRAASDSKIERYYSRFGQYRGLAIWCDMTRDWLEQ